MGLPSINIEFIGKASNAITRSARGIVACIIKDDTEGIPAVQTYSTLNDVDFTKMSESNYEHMKLIFAASPYRVIVAAQATDAADYTATLKKLKDLKWNYLTVPGVTKEETTSIVAWIKEQRDSKRKTFKAVLPEVVADHEGIINCTISNVTTSILDKTISCAAYCARITGIMAAVPLSRSTTYYDLPDIISADVPEDPDAAIDAGQLIAVFDGERYKIGRGVNSLTTIPEGKSEEFKKIKIIEGKDLICDDITSTLENNYIGRVRNSYDKKQEVIAAINNYFRTIEGEILDETYDNLCQIDIEAQKKYLNDHSVDTSAMNDVQIAEANTGSSLFVCSSIKLVDAMEDFVMVNYV